MFFVTRPQNDPIRSLQVTQLKVTQTQTIKFGVPNCLLSDFVFSLTKEPFLVSKYPLFMRKKWLLSKSEVIHGYIPLESSKSENSCFCESIWVFWCVVNLGQKVQFGSQKSEFRKWVIKLLEGRVVKVLGEYTFLWGQNKVIFAL